MGGIFSTKTKSLIELLKWLTLLVLSITFFILVIPYVGGPVLEILLSLFLEIEKQAEEIGS